MRYIFCALLLLLCFDVRAQLKPGYDKQEYLELMRISRKQFEPEKIKDSIPPPLTYKMIYRSPIGPLKNRWDLWVNNQKTAVISIMGSTDAAQSWFENFYSAMVPATGQLHINDTTTFSYHLAVNDKATVHVGWLLGMANIAGTVVQQINRSYSQNGIKNFIIMGHSQGAAVAFLLRSYLADMQAKKVIPADVVFKTYCSAPPKPGNTEYAYEYEFLTAGDWGISVINANDWVTETPSSIQTLADYKEPNPFTDAKAVINKQPFFIRLYARHVYNRLKKRPEKAVGTYQDYLGHFVYKLIKKDMPQFKEPQYAPNIIYTRAGTPVILMPTPEFLQKHPGDPKNIFLYHEFGAYYYVAQLQAQ